jgi:hypothetical protein
MVIQEAREGTMDRVLTSLLLIESILENLKLDPVPPSSRESNVFVWTLDFNQ